MPAISAETLDALVAAAIAARANSHCPYSHWATGAALLASDGSIWPGTNIESCSLSPTICAERSALAAAVSAGKTTFTDIVIVGGPAGSNLLEECWPCGVCRQALWEICGGDLQVWAAYGEDGLIRQREPLSRLLPHPFEGLSR